MTHEIKTKHYPIGETKLIVAKTMEDLRQALNQLSKEGYNLNFGWHGWDDGSVIGHTRDPNFFIQSNEDEGV